MLTHACPQRGGFGVCAHGVAAHCQHVGNPGQWSSRAVQEIVQKQEGLRLAHLQPGFSGGHL